MSGWGGGGGGNEWMRMSRRLSGMRGGGGK